MQMDMQQLPFMMMQNPPPIPSLGLASNPPSQSPFQGATPSHPFSAVPPNLFPTPARTDHMPEAIRNDRVADVTESDKEEGEVSEGSRSPAVNGRAYREPPRSVPLPSTRSSNTQNVYKPDQPSVGQTSDSALQSKATQPASSAADTIAQQQSDAKAFIKLLHNNNIGYHALAAEALDASSLRDLYRSLNLPSEPEPVPSAPKVNGNSQSSLSNEDSAPARPSPPPVNSKPVTAVNTSVPPAKSVPSPANRKEYLAQLQAAKKARQQGGAKSTPPQNTPPPTSAASKALSTPQVTKTSENGQLTEAEKKAKTTELIRKRIEALKKNSSSPAGAATSKPSVTDAYSNPPSKAANSLPLTPNSYATQAIPPSPFGNIPGLFMNPSPVVQSSQPPVTPGSAKRKLSFPVTLDNSPLRADQAMEVDDRRDAVETSAQMTPIQDSSQGARALPVLSSFPSRPASATPFASGMSTPGPQTPSGTTRNQEMDDKARKQAALKERLQKKIEEQKRQAEEKRLASVQNSPTSFPQQLWSLPKSSNGQKAPREPKRRRKADIEAEKSALDVDIAQNAARLAQITKELEMLTANDKKMRLDKERLQAELESFGIDTEGMPHAELQAKKDEIEREQGATLETLTANANLPTISPVMQPSAVPTATISSETVSNPKVDIQYLSQPPEVSTSLSQTGIPGLNASFPLASSLSTATNTRVTINQQTPTLHNAHESASRPEQVIPAKHPAIPSVHGTASNGPSKPATPIDDEEDFYSPEPADVIPVADDTGIATGLTALARSPSEEGEMAMSESDEEEYEPEEAQEPLSQAQVSKGHVLEQNASMLTAQAASFGQSTPINNDEDPYEPPDVDQPMMDLEPIGSAAESKLNAQQGEIEEEEMDMSTSSDSDSDSSSESSEEELNGPAFAPSSKNPGSSETVADDLAPELQPEASAVASVSQELAGPSATQESVSTTPPYILS